MDHNIVILRDDNYDNALTDFVEKLLKAASDKYGISFNLEYCPAGASAMQSFKAPLPDDTLNKAACAHSVFIGGISPAYRAAVAEKLAKALNLYAQISRIKSAQNNCDVYVACDTFGGIYDGEKGFRTNPKFGREAYDTECYSELEIERVARIAYEIAEIDGAGYPSEICENASGRALDLIDKADKLASSKLWRKIVTDINEDYPSVHVRTMTADEALPAFVCDTHTSTQMLLHDIILAPHLFADIIKSVIASKSCDSTLTVAYLGDTSLGMYGIAEGNPISALYATALMLRHSFNLNEAACGLENFANGLAESNACPKTADELNSIINTYANL